MEKNHISFYIVAVEQSIKLQLIKIEEDRKKSLCGLTGNTFIILTLNQTSLCVAIIKPNVCEMYSHISKAETRLRTRCLLVCGSTEASAQIKLNVLPS